MSIPENNKLLLIVNPVSGTKQGGKLAPMMVKKFTDAGYDVKTIFTTITENAYHITLKHGANYGTIVCVGGDGTLKETVCGINELKMDIPVGYVPMGSTNDFAHSIGIPKDTEDAVQAIIEGEPRPLDMGKFGDTAFVYVAGFGNFTSTSYTASVKLKNMIGRKAYYVMAAKEFPKMKGYHARVEADGETFEGDYFYGEASNSYSVGGLPILHNIGVRFDDGYHELVLVKMFKSPADFFSIVKSILTHDITHNDLVVFRHCKSIRFMFDDPTPFTLDGEFGGDQTDITIKTIEHAVRIITREPLPVDGDVAESPDIVNSNK